MTTRRRRREPLTPSRLFDLARSNGPAAIVAGIAFSGSFGHIVKVCNEHGQRGWVGYATAGCVDLLCVLGAEERQRDKRIGRKRRGWMSWPTVVFVLGVTLSLTANLDTASPGGWGHLVAAIPAGALLLAVSVLERRASFTPAEQRAVPVICLSGLAVPPVPRRRSRPVPRPVPVPQKPAVPDSGPEKPKRPSGTGDKWSQLSNQAQAFEMLRKNPALTGADLDKHFGFSANSGRGRKLIAEIAEQYPDIFPADDPRRIAAQKRLAAKGNGQS